MLWNETDFYFIVWHNAHCNPVTDQNLCEEFECTHIQLKEILNLQVESSSSGQEEEYIALVCQETVCIIFYMQLKCDHHRVFTSSYGTT